MTKPLDLDDLLALEKKRDAERLLWAEADTAFRTDVGLVVEIAKASARAYEKHQRKLAEREAEKAQAAAPIVKIRVEPTVESPDEKRRRLARESMRRARARERAARAAEAAGQREAALARAEAFAASRGL